MQEYKEQIQDFIQENFKPVEAKEANFKKSTQELLGFLFQTFPEDCITDYDLNDVMIHLGYKRQSYTIEKRDELFMGWCMFSHVITIPILKIVESE